MEEDERRRKNHGVPKATQVSRSSLPSTELTHVEGFVCVSHTKAVFAGVLRDFVKVGGDEALFLDEFNIQQRLCCQFNGLVKAVFSAIRDVHRAQDFRLQALIQQIRLPQLVLEVCGTCQDETSDVALKKKESRSW